MMRKLSLACLLAVALNLSQGIAQSSGGNPLGGLELLKNYESRRESSTDANWVSGNRDMRPIEPGATLTLCELTGPGMITHIWFTIAHPHPFYSRLLVLRIYWNDEEQPSVESPIGDFFGIGHGIDQPFTSLPIRVTSEGRARNCYWPMPFLKSARITVTNESSDRCNSFYYYIDWQKHPSLPRDAAYFHAMYRQEHPAIMGRNYLLADIKGKGHYVGTIQSVYHSSSGWYGEGDDFFFIDNEKEPRLKGTGTEDYFCDAWGFRQQDGPFYGTPVWEGRNAGDRSSAYRFHLTDPVVFQESLRVEIEHKGQQTFPDSTSTGFIERDDLMSSVAFWYQIEPHKAWPALPPGPDRLVYRSQSSLVAGWQAEKQTKYSEGTVVVQNLQLAVEGKQLRFKPAGSQGWLEIPFEIKTELTVDLFGRMISGPENGIFRILLDDASLGVIDLYYFRAKASEFKWGLRKLSAGKHMLRFECLDRNAASKGFSLGFDVLLGRVPAYLRPDGFDLRSLQKP